MLKMLNVHHHTGDAPTFTRTDPWSSSAALRLLAMALVFAVTADVGGWSPEATAADPVRAGRTFVIEFPHLRPDRRGDVAKMRVRIPDTYRSDQPVPLFIWLGGGNGTSNYGAGVRIADPEKFVLIGLPYPQGANDRRQATMVGDFRRIWAYHQAMLHELGKQIPNIDPDNVSVGGFSNGAHCIDGYLKMTGPSKFFNTFVIAEGGGYRSGRYGSAVRDKRVLVLWGDSSPHRSTGYRLARKLHAAGMDVTRMEMSGTRHSFPVDYQKEAGKWFLP